MRIATWMRSTSASSARASSSWSSCLGSAEAVGAVVSVGTGSGCAADTLRELAVVDAGDSEPADVLLPGRVAFVVAEC